MQGGGTRKRQAALHAPGAVEEDGRCKRRLLDREEADALLTPVLENHKVRALELVNVSPLCVRDGHVQDDEVGVDAHDLVIVILLRAGGRKELSREAGQKAEE